MVIVVIVIIIIVITVQKLDVQRRTGVFLEAASRVVHKLQPREVYKPVSLLFSLKVCSVEVLQKDGQVQSYISGRQEVYKSTMGSLHCLRKQGALGQDKMYIK